MLLPEPDALRNLVASFAAIHAEFGTEFGQRALVLPTAEFFPDEFSADAKGAKRLVHRMRLHAAMDDIPVHVAMDDGPVEAQGGGCGSGSCGTGAATASSPRLTDRGDDWVLALQRHELLHPVSVTTLIARALATIFLEETRRSNWQSPLPREVLTDLTAVGLGFGVLLMEGSYQYQKSCGGPHIAKWTALGVSELAVLVALFASEDSASLKRALRVVGTTQREALRDARSWLNGNQVLANQLHSAPELLATGLFELAPPKGDLFGWLRRGNAEPEPALPASTSLPAAREMNPARKRPGRTDDGLGDLVAEALAERATAEE